MQFRARVEVGLKLGHSDPEGDTTRQSLKELKYPVKSVGVSKVYDVLLEARSKKEAMEVVEEMCKRLLANPVKDNYRFEIEEVQ